jgi:hypothetical protein
MGSGSSGITSGGGGAVPLSVTDQGVVDLPNGVSADLTTAEGLSDAEAVLDPASLAELKALMAAKGFKLEGGAFVPSDTFNKGVVRSAAAGPKDINSGMTEADELTGSVFKSANSPVPFNANTTPALYGKLKGNPAFADATAKLKAYMENPTDANLAAYKSAYAKLGAQLNGVNMMEVLYLVMRESIQGMNEDKRYFLERLEEYNKMGQQLSEYLKTLTEASQRISEQSKGKDLSKDQVYVQAEIRDYKLGSLDKDGKLPYTSEMKEVDRNSLNDQIKNVEADQETVRNKRQMASTAFQNFDQKSNQMYNMLASVIKTMQEMRGIGTKAMM